MADSDQGVVVILMVQTPEGSWRDCLTTRLPAVMTEGGKAGPEDAMTVRRAEASQKKYLRNPNVWEQVATASATRPQVCGLLATRIRSIWANNSPALHSITGFPIS